MADKPPVAASAPAYEPEKWNNMVTPARLKEFLDQNREAVLKVAQRYASMLLGFPGSAAFDGLSHRERTGKIDSLASEVRRHDGLLKDDTKLAEYYGIDPKDIGKVKAAFAKIREELGYEGFSTCYTYAMNDNDGIDSWWASDSGRPGSRAGVDGAINEASNAKDYAAYQTAIMKGLVADGATDAGKDAQPKDGYYRVAVYTLPNELMPKGDNGVFDFHFVRENRDGGWSHKFGARPVTDKDQDGKPFADPRNANLGGYEFIGFVYVPEGGLDVGSPHEPKTKPGSIEAKKYETSAAQIPDMDAMTAQVLSAMRLPPVPRPESAPAVVEQRRAPKPEFSV